MIQSQIPLDEICEIVGISRFAAISHGEMRAEGFDLVLVRLHLDDRSTCRHVRCEEDVVFTCRRLSAHCGGRMEPVQRRIVKHDGRETI